MTRLKRIRVDRDGLLTQSATGRIERIVLSEDDRVAVKADPQSNLIRFASRYKVLGQFLDGDRLDARIDIADEPTECLSRPLRIYYGIEPRCDLACTFCGPRDLHDRFKPAGADQEAFLLAQIAAAGAFQVQLTGGEIVFRGRELLRALKQTQELGLGVILATNGVWRCIRGKDEFIRRLAAFEHIIQTKISIEGTREFHDSVRGSGTYDEAVDTLRRLADAGLKPRISATIFRSSCNAEQLEHLVGLAQRFGASFQPIPLRPVGRAARMTDEVPTPAQLAAYTRHATALRREAGVPISFNFDIFESGQHIPIYDVHRPPSCGAPLWGVHVTHLGDVYPCGFVQAMGAGQTFAAGRVSSGNSLLDIWLNSEVLKRVRNAGKSATCQACSHYGTECWGGCWVMAWNSSARVDGIDPYCLREYEDGGAKRSPPPSIPATPVRVFQEESP